MTTQLERDLYCLRRAGYMLIPSFLSGHELAAISEKARAFEEEVIHFVEAGGEAILRHEWPLVTTRCLFAIAAEFQDLVMDANIQHLVQGYLGEAVLRDILVQTNMPDPRNKRRGIDGDVSFHRDTLWPDGEIQPRYLHVFLLLTPFTRANGATIVVPGTHRQREPGYYFKHTDPRSSQPGIEYRVYEQRYFSSAVPLEAPNGTLILLDPMTIHTQGINVSEDRRSLLNMTFRAADVVGTPALLNARAIAERYAREPVRTDLMELLESDPSLPAHFGPLGNQWPSARGTPQDTR